MLKEFREFAMRGNVMDLAVGVIIGAAFQQIVTSLVNDMIMPIISIITGKVDLSELSLNVGEISIRYGSFLNTIMNFLIIAFSIFLIVKYINKINKKMEDLTQKELEKLNKKLNKNSKKKRKKEEPKPIPTTRICPYCLSEIKIKATKCPHCTSEQPSLKDANVTEGQIELKEESIY